MEPEAKILERLQELRRWQMEQEERLLKQQEQQRDLLSMEQDRIYEALSLSLHNLSTNDSMCGDNKNSSSRDIDFNGDHLENINSERSLGEDNSKSSIFEDLISQKFSPKIENQVIPSLIVPPLQLTATRYLNHKSSTDGFSPRSETPTEQSMSVLDFGERTPERKLMRTNEVVMEGVTPLPADKPSQKLVPLDDLPVPSPKKDFTTLLEERLRDFEANETSENSNKPQIKRPFLKKGEGLARFKPNPNSANRRTARPRSSSLSANMRLTTTSNSRGNTPKLKETPKSSRAVGASGKANIPPTAQSKLSLKNVPPPKKKVRRKSMCDAIESKPSATKLQVKPPVDTKKASDFESKDRHELQEIKKCGTKLQMKPAIDMNYSSDFETKTRRELEEMRIFELLEEKAQNSSFCSNSSTVLALFQQSTPIKTKNSLKSIPDRKRVNREASDTSLEEIVRTTGSNRSVPGSPVTKIRETVIQKDYVISQWETPNKENTNSENRFSNRAITAGTYKTTKHTTIQFNNNNNNNNNGIENKKSVSGEDIAKRGKYEIDQEDKMVDETSPENENGNVSLHVRFSEYNEYKTIGLTDTSIMSNDSVPQHNRKEEKAWSDLSVSPDSSDVEILFSKNEKNTGNARSFEKLSDASSKSEFSCDEELTDQMTDNEDDDYTSVCSNEESGEEGNTTITDKRELKKNSHGEESSDHGSENCNDSGSTIEQTNDELSNIINSVHRNDTVFKSELLKNCLAEVEREIDIFRKENAALAIQRKKLQDESRQLHKEFKIKEENLEKERKSNEETLQEERKRLAREKAALENRLRDAREKSLQSKQERQEMQLLREQLDQLREEASQKESRWQAAQARQKSQIRVLQTENSRLKQELEKLRAKKANTLTSRKSQISNTRSIHQISKQLDNKKKIVRKDSSSDEERLDQHFGKLEVENAQTNIDDKIEFEENEDTVSNFQIQKKSSKGEDEVHKKRSLYTNLLNEATEGLRGNEEIVLGKHEKTPEKVSKNISEDESRSESESNPRIIDNSPKFNSDRMKKKTMSPEVKNPENTEARGNRSPGSKNEDHEMREPRRWSDGPFDPSEKMSQPATRKQEIREIQCPDGHTEVWYPNGNVKKIYPDRNVIKMIYYNGDVRETLENGSVKYFYASTRTWHTTLPDGLEILEFPDGQVERRTKDGSSEVSFPDGSIRLLQADGTEKWILPDGTVAETFPDGNKILSFPNGQREIHTQEHKRREYPDGTVKFVYPDGTQETRYSTGRVRVKDKDGNLLMDVHHR